MPPIGHRTDPRPKHTKPKLVSMCLLLVRHVAIGIAITVGLFAWAWADGSLTGRRHRK